MDEATRIEIFRPGTFTSVEGVQVTYSADDLAAIAKAYDPAVFESPLVIGHPALDAPAYGWVDRLEMQGDILVAVPKQVEPSFAETVAAGRYKKTSAQLYPADHPFNPKPGSTYLKHVGFLGAAAPSVKGLKSLSFSEEQVAGTVTIDIDHEEPPVSKEKTAEEISFAERVTAFEAREAAMQAREAEIAERERAAAEKTKADRHAANVSFAEAQVTAVKLAPAGKALVIGLLDQLDATTPISFGEGDANQLTPNDAFRKLFDTASPIVSFGEIANRETAPDDEDGADALASKALSFAEAEVAAGRPRPSATQAVNHVKRQAASAA